LNSLYQQLIAVLTRYMSGVNAHGVVGRAIRASLLDPEQLSPNDLKAMFPTLDRGIRLFVEPSRQPQLWTELEALGGRKGTSSQSVNIRSEQDISQARVMAKAMCESARARSFVAQKVATVVSELARNIVSYTPGGAIELVMSNDSHAKILVRATDSGTGIPNIDEVLSGKYRSTTGLGRGLLGVKRLADRFDIKTGKTGTSIEAEVLL
jgi:serine/threonine-protein kinase RsbT